MHPVVTDMRKAEAILAWAVDKMEERYALLARAGVRHISVYNQLGRRRTSRPPAAPNPTKKDKAFPGNLPYIVIVADELADLMMTAGKEVEQHIIRLAQKSRAVGIHLILATQKPTVDVITGLIKSNLPARIAFQVASRTDSRVVLDEMGADKLLGNGDMLFLSPGTQHAASRPGHVPQRRRNHARRRLRASIDEPQFADELMQLKTKDEREAAASGRQASKAATTVRSRRRHRRPRRPRQLFAAAARARHRLRPRRPADRLHGRRRHRRPLQRRRKPAKCSMSLEDWESRHNQNADSSAHRQPHRRARFSGRGRYS